MSLLLTELGTSRRRRCEYIKESGFPQESGTLFVPSNQFKKCSSRTQYTLSTSSTDQKLQKMAEFEESE